MSGIDYLLDTNVILGLLKSAPETLEVIQKYAVDARGCGYSAITRMELLGFPGLQPDEEALIQDRLKSLIYLPVTLTVENEAIRVRRVHDLKLPEAIIAATALTEKAALLTHDQKLCKVMEVEV